MKNWRLLAGAVLGVAIIAAALATQQPNKPQQAVPRCGEYRTDKVVTIGSEKIKAEVVETVAEQEKGLSGRPCIEPDRGMLFVHQKPGRYPIWMKDMKFPIDIVWINRDRQIIGYDFNVEPSTYPDSFVSEKPAQYILELQANRAKNLDIKLGTPVNF